MYLLYPRAQSRHRRRTPRRPSTVETAWVTAAPSSCHKRGEHLKLRENKDDVHLRNWLHFGLVDDADWRTGADLYENRVGNVKTHKLYLRGNVEVPTMC